MKQLIKSLLITSLGVVVIGSASHPKITDTSPFNLKQTEFKQINAIEASKVENVVSTANITKTAPEAPKTSSGGNIEQIIIDAANKYGISPDYALKIARCESGLNPNAVNYGYNENGYPSGLFQHLSGYYPARAAKYGYSTDVFDAYSNANTTMAMFADGLSYLWECR